MGNNLSSVISPKKPSDQLDNMNSISDNFKNLEPTFILDSDVNDKIKKLNEYINKFNVNDTNSLISIIKEFQQKSNKLNGSKYNFQGIENFIVNFHQTLQKELNNIGDGKNISDVLNNDETLKKYMDIIKKNKTEEIFRDISNNDILKNNIPLQENVKTILNNINNMNVKHKFFEYKYIQINLFLIIFIEHVSNTMTDFMEKTIQYSLLRDAKKKNSIQELTNILMQILNDDRVNLDSQNFNMINDIIKNTNNQLKENQNVLNDKLKKMKDQSFNEIVNFLANNAFTTERTVDEYTGGAIRAGSVIPQEFYNIN